MEELKKLNNEEERYERKFLISELTLKEIEKIILDHPFIFSKIFYERKVNNLYLDFVDMENYAQNIMGNPQRLKIRIRWYGELFGLIKKPVLELKIKNGDILKKLSFPLKEFTSCKKFSGKFLQKEIFNKSNLPNWLNETLKSTKLSLLNCYNRKYFLSDNKRYRITLDYDLVFFEIHNKNNSFEKKIRDRQNIILEIKYDKKDDNLIAQLTQNFPFRLTKSSKYVSGIDFCLDI